MRLERHDIPAVLGTGQTFDTLLTYSINKPINAVKAPPGADEGGAASSALYRHTGFGNRILLQSPTLKRTLSSEKVIWKSSRASTNFTVPAVEEIKRPVRSVPCRVRPDRGLTKSRPFIVSSVRHRCCRHPHTDSRANLASERSSFDHMFGKGPRGSNSLLDTHTGPATHIQALRWIAKRPPSQAKQKRWIRLAVLPRPNKTTNKNSRLAYILTTRPISYISLKKG